MHHSRRDGPSFPLQGSVRQVAAVVFCVAGIGAPAGAAPARQAYSISEFDSVRLEAPLDVVVTTDKGVSASATGDRDTLDRIDLRVNSGTLIVRLRAGTGFGGGPPRLPTQLSVSTNLLQRAVLMGAGTLSVDRLKGAKTEATMSGGGRLTVARIEADRLNVGLAGSGTMTLAGAVADGIVTISGSGRLDAAALAVQRLHVDTEGSADAQLTARETASATTIGTGRIAIAGKATCTVRKTGSAGITCGDAVY